MMGKNWIRSTLSLFLVILLLAGGITLKGEPVLQTHAAEPSLDTQVSFESRIDDAVILYLGSNLAKRQGLLTPIDIGRNGTAPFLQDGHTMVPIRFLAESLGGTAAYDGKTGLATIKVNQNTMQIRNGDKTLRINGVASQLPTAPLSRNGRLYAPLRAISEAMHMGVFYHKSLIVVAPGAVFLDAGTHRSWIEEQIRLLGMVQVAKSEADLLAQLQDWHQNRDGYPGITLPPMMTDDVTWETADSLAPQMSASAESSGKAGESMNAGMETAPAPQGEGSDTSADSHSETNLQVSGVDEGDIIKTDGTHLYQVNRMRVFLIRAVPADQMKLVSTIQLGSENITPQEIYVDNGRLVIIGSAVVSTPAYPVRVQPAGDSPTFVPSAKTDEMNPSVSTEPANLLVSTESSILPVPIPPKPYNPPVQSTRVLTYDVSNPSNPVRLGSYEIEGSLLSSRRIDNQLYLVTNKQFYGWYDVPDVGTPVYRYGVGPADGSWKRVEPTTVSWCPDFTQANYLVVSGIQLDKPSRAPSLYTLLGAGQTVYATADSLFVAVQQSKPGDVMLPESMLSRKLPAYRESTDIYRFTLEAGAATLVSRGTVPGRLLNQFSMDWHEAHLRVATTLGWASQTGEPTSTNQLYTLDAMMNLTGAILDIAPGEQIYSTRFMGDRGYMVTYRNVDPLYVLDLEDPTKPAILGELKIPGYSNYLHPYQEGYLIGFGKDSVELQNQWDPTTSWAYYQGLKVALFDVRDVKNPKLLHETHIGDRGTDSELLRNHRALLFSPTRNLMAFPVNLYEVGGSTPADGQVKPDASIEYGTFTWQGLMAYRLTLQNGFEKLADISHLEPGDLWNQERHVSRGAYIGNILYSLSNREVRATSMETWKETGRLVLP